MKISLESTDQVVSLNGVPARVWQGTTESGVSVQAFITRIAIEASHEAACEQVARELEETSVPAAVQWPQFMILDGDAPQQCRVCGCTDDDCSLCVERTGAPCSWVAEDLCSACAPAAAAPSTTGRTVDGEQVPKHLARMLDDVVRGGIASEDEAQAALEYFSELADREISGAITRESAAREVIEFALLQNASRREVKS